MTHTYALMDVSTRTYIEIRDKLLAAGYEHAIHPHADGHVLDMHGIALRAPAPAPEDPRDTGAQRS